METTTTTQLNFVERFNNWIKESIMVKLFSIGFLLLILLIPSAWIQNIMEERQQRADSVVQEVSDSWSGSQTVAGPILVIPYKKYEVIDRGKGQKDTYEKIEKAYFLPEQLDVNGKVSPELLHRGIFDAVVYQSALQLQAKFTKPDFKALSIDEQHVLWAEAKLIFGISDLRGISENPVLTNGTATLATGPLNNIGVTFNHSVEKYNPDEPYRYQAPNPDSPSTGIVAALGWKTQEDFSGDVAMNFALKGSKRLDFVPMGKTTNVKLDGPWKDPSFSGEFLPASRKITDKSFEASWKVLHFNRPFSQQWTGEGEQLTASDFGVKLLIPVDQYQKSIRTAKYAVLMILLTFVAMFLVEITQKIRIHPFQYILIGAALIIYYTLLLSFSEHVGYNVAYLIASISTVVLISLYASTFLKKISLTTLFAALLSIFYTFIFVIILQQDFSLLLGSIGLFIIVGLLMYFSRKVKWYEDENLKFKAES